MGVRWYNLPWVATGWYSGEKGTSACTVQDRSAQASPTSRNTKDAHILQQHRNVWSNAAASPSLTPRHVTTGITNDLPLCDSFMRSSCFLSSVVSKHKLCQELCQAALSASQDLKALCLIAVGWEWAAPLWAPDSCTHSPTCFLHLNVSRASLTK